jgi:hypothetical protein
LKIFYLTLFLLITSESTFSQVSEWMVIDLQELIHYEMISDFFDFDLSKQEILEISEGDYGAIWLTTQD